MFFIHKPKYRWLRAAFASVTIFAFLFSPVVPLISVQIVEAFSGPIIVSPGANETVSPEAFAPNVTWDVDAGTCAYNYGFTGGPSGSEGWTEVSCLAGGADIAPPSSEGPTFLHVGEWTGAAFSGGSYASDNVSFTYSSVPPVMGCMDPGADNYNPSATQDDGSCSYGGGMPGPTAPGQVTDLGQVGITENSVTLFWNGPADDGGDSITDYVVEYQLHNASDWQVFTDGVQAVTTTATVTGLTADTQYDFRVSAVNGIGQGSSSSIATFTTTPVLFSSGDGSSGDPYVIASCSGVEAIENDLTASYVLGSDLDCSSSGNAIVIGDETDPFTGTFSGDGHTIAINIESTSNSIGLFSRASGATISDVQVDGSVVTTGTNAGGLVGYASDNTSIDRVLNNSSVRASTNAGGLVGYADNSHLTDVYNKGEISLSGSSTAGGIVGYFDNNSSITNAYNSGPVGWANEERYHLGGIVGWRHYNGTSTISNSFNVGPVRSSYLFNAYGGITGADIPSMETLADGYTNNWYDGYKTGHAICAISNSGTLFGSETGKCEQVNADSLNPNYFKSELTSAPMSAWSSGVWQPVVGGYPELISIDGDEVDNSPFTAGNGTNGNPYIVSSCSQLTYLAYSSGAYFSLNQDLDCLSLGNAVIIGDATHIFTGVFDGQGHKITIAIDNPTTTHTGLFRRSSGATIKNLWVDGSIINANANDVGGVLGLGDANTLISSVRSTVSISGTGHNYGGIVGFMQGNGVVSDSYWTGTINAQSTAGGIAGFLYASYVDHAYSTGSVTTTADEAGGIVGYMSSDSGVLTTFSAAHISLTPNSGGIIGNLFSGTVDGSYWDSTTSGISNCVGSVPGLIVGCEAVTNPLDFKGNDTNPPFSGVGDMDYDWDFATTWEIAAAGYPALQSVIGDELANSPFAGGDGSVEHPYQIASCAGFSAISEAGLDKAYLVTQDLDCTSAGNSIMIGTYGAPYTGIFNGGGHKVVIDLSSVGVGDNFIGLFRATQGGQVHNIRIGGTVDVSTQQGAGSLAGRAYSTYFYQVTSDAVVTSDYFNVGGLIGEFDASVMEDAYFSGSVTANINVGGLVGIAGVGSRISRTYSSGAVHSDAYHNRVGGLIGMAAEGSAITVEDSFVVGPLDTPSYPIIAQDSGTTTYTNNFYDITRTGSDMSCSNTQTNEAGKCSFISYGGNDPDYFKNNSTNAPFTREGSPAWDFGSVWFTVENDYPILQSIDYPDPVEIDTPVNDLVSVGWQPSVRWGESTVCEYKYGDSSFSTVNCSNDGSDIPAPVNSYQSTTLTIRGATLLGDVLTDASTFFYYPTDQGSHGATDMSWTAQSGAGIQGWQSLAGSADGSHLIAAGYGGYVKISSDYGETWTTIDTLGTSPWSKAYSSGTGQYLAVGGESMYLKVSSNFGLTWRTLDQSGAPFFETYGHRLTMSADGKYWAVIGPNTIHLSFSDDYGETWTDRSDISEGHTWRDIAGSATGEYLVAILRDRIYLSEDYGGSWRETSAFPDDEGNLRAIAISADGGVIAAVFYPGYVYLSNDLGNTWSKQTALGNHFWESIGMSADGSTLATGLSYDFGYPQGLLQVSFNSGLTWNAQTSPGESQWRGFSVSADGTHIAAASGGVIWTAGASGGDEEEGVDAVAYDGGDGSTENPYQISSCLQLQGIGQDIEHLEAHYILTQNIDCSATSISNPADPDYDADLYREGLGFNPIGDYLEELSFTGSLSGEQEVGGSYMIQNLFMDRGTQDYLGLFSSTNGAVIDHVQMRDAEIENDGSHYVGGFIGYANQTRINDVTFEGEVYGSSYTGGIVGYFGDSEQLGDEYGIEDSYSYVTLTTGGPSSSAFGGIAGYLDYAYIHNSYSGSEGPSILDGSDGATQIGGMVGYLNHGAITDSSAHTVVTGYGSVGGLVGYMRDSVVRNVELDSEVHGGTEEDPVGWTSGFGGIIGISEGDDTIEDNTVNTSVHVLADYGYIESVGGIAGSVCWDDSNCSFDGNTASGDITVTLATTGGEWNNAYCIGGIAGCLYGYNNESDGSAEFTNNSADVAVAIIVDPGVNTHQTVEEVGGLFGRTDNAQVKYSDSSGTVSVQHLAPSELEVTSIGGLIGDAEDYTRLYDNSSSSSITITSMGEESAISSVGGLIGYSEGYVGASIKRSVSTGTISVTGQRVRYVGGIIGRTYDRVLESYSDSDIAIAPYTNGSEANSIGGLVGRNYDDASIRDSYATGNVTVSGSGSGFFESVDDVAGLAGQLNGPVARTYSTGSISITAFDAYNIAGLIGFTNGTVGNSFTTSHISIDADSSSDIGALVANFDDATDLSNNYFDMAQTGYEACSGTETTNEECQAINTGGLGDVTDGDYFKNSSTNPPLDTWNFEDIWQTDTNDYPTLRMDVPDFEWLGGDGSAEDPYLVDSCDALMRISNDLSASYLLVRSINCGFIPPIGVMEGAFTGSFDGGGNQITYSLQANDFQGLGLFWFLDGATITNLSIDTELDGISLVYVGALTGYATDNSYIENVTAYGSVDIGGSLIGGLVGALEGSTIINSKSYASVTGDINVGGLVGENISGTIIGAESYSEVNGNENVGGLVGHADLGEESDLMRRNFSSSTVYGNTNVGGLVGYLQNGEVSDSYSISSVNGYQNVGGLIGLLEDSYLLRTYARGTIIGNGYESEQENENIGGLVGYADEDSRIENSFSSAYTYVYSADGGSYGPFQENVTNIGAIAGFYGGTTENFINNYYDQAATWIDVCTEGGTSVMCTAVNTENEDQYYFQNNDSNPPLDAWDFENVWGTDGYPYLRQYSPDASVVVTGDASDITETTATIAGNVTENPEGYYAEYGVVYAPHGESLDDDSLYVSYFADETPIIAGPFTVNLMELSCGTEYDYKTFLGTMGPRLYADNIGTFTTSPCVDDEDLVTEAPVLGSPASSRTYARAEAMTVTFTLPEDMLSGSLTLTFTPAYGSSVVLNLRDAESGHPNSFTFTPSGGFETVTEILSASAGSIPAGVYSVTLSYRDAAGNAAATATKTSVRIKSPSFGGGGGGGGGRVAPPAVAAPTIPGVPAVPATDPVKSCSANLYPTQSIKLGTTNNPDQVKLLEQYLNTYEGFRLPVDGIFSQADMEAVARWQEKYAAEILAPLGITKGTGIIAVKSLAKIHSVFSSRCQAVTAPGARDGMSGLPSLTKLLKFGMKDPLVAPLQAYLNAHGHSVGTADGWFGQKTLAAVKAFQSAHGLLPDGIVGALTWGMMK